jgi:hypothetical protein
LKPVPVPESLKTEVVIPQQIAGVDVGWLLTWVKDLLAPTNVIDLTVSYEADGKKATLFGQAKGRNGYAFYVRDEGGLADEIAQAAAAAIIQNEQRRDEIAVQPLPSSKYLPVVDALSAYATYEKVVRSYRDQHDQPNFKAQYITQLQNIGPIAETYVQWGELQWLAAEIAERAEDRQKALTFTENEQRITPRDDLRYPRLAARLKRLNEVTVAAASAPDQREKNREKAGHLLDEITVAPFRALLDIPSPLPAHTGVRIAFVGQPWPQALKNVKSKILLEAKQQHESLNDYTTSLMQTTRIVAPNAFYEFVGVESSSMGSLSGTELIKGLSVIQASDADVLIFGYGPGNSASLKILRDLAGKKVVVLAAGNGSGASSYASLDDVALVVSSIDGNGRPTLFTDSSPRSVAAPGSNIPTVSPATGEVIQSTGTSHSAALAGGAAALLRAKYPTATPIQIVTALHDTAKAPARLIDVTAASQKLDELLRSASGKT